MADIFYDGKHIPVQENLFEGVLLTQVLEHVPNPDAIVADWARVLKGVLLVTMPFMWTEHVMTYDYQRYSIAGLSALLQKHGFIIVEQRRLLSDYRAPAQLLLAWIFDVILIKCRPSILQLLLVPVRCAPIFILASILAAISPPPKKNYQILI